MNVAIIPARGGSVRIPRKNIRTFHVKHMLGYSVETAKASGLFDRVLVSTEDEEIATIAQRYGAQAYRRPEYLCEDRYGPHDIAGALLMALQYADDYRPDFACCIYATAPMLRSEDLERGLMALRNGFNYAISVAADPAPLTDAAQFIWGRASCFVRGSPLMAEGTALIPIPSERVCDINTPEDWTRAEAMFSALQEAACA